MPDITPDSLQIARLEERMATMHRDMSTQQEQLAALQEQVAQVLSALSEAKGGWRTLMWLGGCATALGAGVSWAITHLQIK
jgi:multidrug resistance efflux pump